VSITNAAGVVTFGAQTENTTIDSGNVDTSRAYELGVQGGDLAAGAVKGADLNLVDASGNVFNLADPTLTLAASAIARDSIGMAYGGLERITDASNLAVTRALDLAETTQAGEGGQITDVTKTLIVGAAIVAGVVVLAKAFQSRGK